MAHTITLVPGVRIGDGPGPEDGIGPEVADGTRSAPRTLCEAIGRA
jgi:hypothetical protein